MKHLLNVMATGVLAFAGLSDASATNEAPKPEFVPCDTLLEAEVALPNDEKQGNAEDLVIDARDGRVTDGVIDTGMLGSKVAIPYGALAWQSRNEKFTLHATEEQLQSLPEFDPDNLASLQNEARLSTLRSIFGERKELTPSPDAARGDEYTCLFPVARAQKIDGQIIAVNRAAMSVRGRPYYAVMVAPDTDKDQHTVFLAPIAYFSGQKTIPREGDDVTIVAVRGFNAEGEPVYVASSCRLNGTSLNLRNEKGVPEWTVKDGDSRIVYHMLASEFADGEMYVDGKSWASVDDLVVEVHSGSLAFAVVSVGGVLGINDTLYPIPWEVLTVGADQRLYIGMPESKLKLAPKLSEEGVADLKNEQFVRSVHEYFGVEPRKYNTARSSEWRSE